MSHYHAESNQFITNWTSKQQYHSMLTVKFNTKNTSLKYESRNEENLKLIDFMLRNMNQRIYGRQYKKKNQFIGGFLSIEKNMKKSANKFHVHILFFKDDKMSRFSSAEILDIAIRSSAKLTNSEQKKCFIHKKVRNTINKDNVKGLKTSCMQIVGTYNKYADDYVVKSVNSLKFDQIKILDRDGLTDKELEFFK